MGVAYLHLWVTQSIGKKGMFYKKFLSKPCATLYTWRLLTLGRTYANKTVRVFGAYCGGNHHDKTSWREGCTPWQIGPPSISSSKKKISIGNRYEYRKHRTKFV